MSATRARDGKRPSRLLGRLLLGFLICVGVAGAVRYWPRRSLTVRAVQATVGTVRDVVSSSSAGEVTPEMHASVRAEISGRVLAVKAQRGGRVRRGELIVQLDPADLDARVRQAQAALDGAHAGRLQAQARLETLKRQSQRANLLAQAGAGTVQISEDARAAVTEAEIAVKAAEGQQAQSQAALQLARVQRARSDFLAPFDGVLTELTVNLGDSLTPGAPVFKVLDDGRLHVDAVVDEADAARVRVGQSAELHLDALPGRDIAGRVARVDPVVKRDLKGARSLTVEVEVVDLPAARAAGLIPGMSANVEVLVAEKRDVLAIPSNVIVGRGVSRYVYRLDPVPTQSGTYRAHRQVVSVGLSNWDRTEISAGLVPHAWVVTSLNEKGLDDGVLVRIAAQDSTGVAPPAGSR